MSRCGASKGFVKALKAFWSATKKCENKVKLISSLSPESRLERLTCFKLNIFLIDFSNISWVSVLSILWKTLKKLNPLKKVLNKASQKIENLKGVVLKLPKSVLVQGSMSYRTRSAYRIFSCFRRFGQAFDCY